jgi:hypothetical protein
MKDKRIKKGDQVRATRDLLAEDRILIKKGCRGQVLGWMQYSWKVRWFGHNGMPIGWHLPPDIMLEKDYPKRSSKDRDLATRLHGVLAVLDRGRVDLARIYLRELLALTEDASYWTWSPDKSSTGQP